jgi:hypothetical protein
MATITAASITTGDSLDTFRRSFNTLRSDIQGLSFGAEIVFEGTTADDFETTLLITDPTVDRTVTIQDKSGTIALTGRDINDVIVLDATDGSGTDEASAIILNASAVGVDVGDALLYEIGTGDHIVNPVLQIAGNFVFEGATADAFETTLAITDPTADRTITLQDKTGIAALIGRDINDIIILNATDGSGTDEASAIILDGDATAVDGVVVNVGEALLYEEGTGDHLVNPLQQFAGDFVFEGSTIDEFQTTLSITDPTADRTVTIQNKTGTIALKGRDIEDVILLNGTNAAGANSYKSAIILDGDATDVVGVVANVGEALLYEEGTNDHIVNPTFEDYEEFIILEVSTEDALVFLTRENIDESSVNARFAYQSATSDNLLGSLFLPPAGGGPQFITPISDGIENQILGTDGSGNLSFINQSSGLSLNNDGNNRVITATGSNSGNGEANLTFDGSTLAVTGAVTSAAITASGIIKTDDTTAATSTTDGSLQTDGGLSVALDAVIGDDLFMLSDAAVITFGAGKDVTLTHVHDTGLLLNSTMAIQFNDASQFINAPSNAILDINATDEIELNATLVDVNANLDVSGTYTGAGLMTTGGNIVIPNAGNIGSVGDTNAIAISSGGVVALSATTASTSKTTGALTVAGGAGISLDLSIGDDIFMLSDGAVITFGANSEIALTHVHNVGLQMTSTVYAPLSRRGEDVFIVMDQSAAAGTDAGDNIIMDRSAASTDVGDDIIGEDEVFLHSGMQRNVIEIRDSGGNLLNSLAGFAPGAI